MPRRLGLRGSVVAAIGGSVGGRSSGVAEAVAEGLEDGQALSGESNGHFTDALRSVQNSQVRSGNPARCRLHK
jgi:hypothetical protein